MRTLFLLLVLANVALYLWLQRQQPEPLPPPAATESGIAPLVLLSERPAAAMSTAAAPQPQEIASAPPVPAPAPAEPLLRAVPDAAPDSAGTGRNGDTAARPEPKAEPPAGARPEPHPAPKAIAVPRLQSVLVAAPPRARSAPVAAPQVIAPEPLPAPALNTGLAGTAAAPAAASAASCYTAGPFMQPAEAAQFAAQLAARGLRADTRVSDKKEEAGYWVYLPPYPSAEAARAVTAELAAKGEKEYFILRPGDAQANAISLGVFRDRKLAERRHEKLRAMGYPAELSIRYRDSPVSWVDFAVGAGELAPERLALPAGAQRHARTCDPPS